jgi:hypothetical protein
LDFYTIVFSQKGDESMTTKTTDRRPSLWVGHIAMQTDQLEASLEFMIKIGMRPIFKGDDVAILELRGGTHIVLEKSDDLIPGEVDFDLMVDDIAVTHAEFAASGLHPTPVEAGRIHQSFTLTEPAGNTILFNSTHVSEEPV